MSTQMTREQAAQRIEQLSSERDALNGGAAEATAETWAAIATLHEEEARIWHDVWHDIVDDRGPGGGPTASLLTRAAIIAEHHARDAAQFWRAQGKAERGAR